MDVRRTLFTATMAVLGSGLVSGGEVQVLRDSRGRELGTLEQSEYRAVMRDSSGRLVWWHCEEPAEVKVSLALKTEPEKEENLLIQILKVPAVTIGVILGLSIALVKTIANR